MGYLDLLNNEQILPVKDTEGAVLVIAGAGSGKTRVLTSRIAYLVLEKNIPGQNILAITFTNKAAGEMKDRLTNLIGNKTSGMWISTIHSMCVRILRNDINKLQGYNSNFSIYSDQDKERVIKRIAKEIDSSDESLPKQAKSLISEAKTNGVSPVELLEVYSYTRNIKNIAEVYIRYELELKSSNALDFDDLLIKAYQLLATNKEVLDYYSNRFLYIHVDEFQDTNKIQCQLVNILAMAHGNIFVVGDDDQSIYGWRGAEIQNILGFSKLYKGAKVYKLEQNYRSSKKILELANAIITKNTKRSNKLLWTENAGGDKVEVYVGDDENAEASYCARTIKSLVNMGANYRDFAVLMRMNALSRPFEQEFIKYDIPSKVYGGFKFFERKEIKDLTAYLRVLVNPLDDESLLRIVNVPKRKIGEKTIETLAFNAHGSGLSVYDVISTCEMQGFTSSVCDKLIAFRRVINDLKNDLDTMPISDLVSNVIKKTNFLSQFEENTDENNSKRMNVNEFSSSVYDYERLNPTGKLADYLASITLSSDMDSVEEGDAVTIATIHSAKGLEFDNVFVVGLDDGIFPVSRSRDSQENLEEERRLMYVAVTRAKQHLFLTRAHSRFLYGSRSLTTQSCYLSDCADILGIARRERIEEKPYSIPNDEALPSKPIGKVTNFSKTFSRQDNPSKGKNLDEFIPGKKVKHLKFGFGTITDIKITRGEVFADILFDDVGMKKLVVSIAPLEIVED